MKKTKNDVSINLSKVEESKELVISIRQKVIRTKKQNSSSLGRPNKFKEPIVSKINLGLTQTQLDLIEARMSELNQTVRLDYIRSLIAKDIEDFEF